MTTLRNVVGGMDLEETLTIRDEINGQLRGVLDEATGKWGIRVNRVELKAIDPPAVDPGLDGEADARRPRQARRDPHRRGPASSRRSSPPRARSSPRSCRAEGQRAGGDPAGRGRGEGDRDRLRGDPRRQRRTRSCSPTSTCRCCRRSPRATSNKVWIIPSELQSAVGRVAGAVKDIAASQPPAVTDGKQPE